jgi:hypothetical protein
MICARKWMAAAVVGGALLAGGGPATVAEAVQFPGRRGPAGAVPGPGGVVNLPYSVQDNRGNQWRVYQGGWLQQQGNQPVYSQGAQITVNGNQPQMNNNQGRVDEKTGELVLENLNAQGLLVTRRILIDKEQALVRYIDVIKNPGAQPVQAQVQIQTNFNYGVNATQTVADPKRKGQELAWVAQTGAGPAVMEVYAGKGAKNAFQIMGPNQNSYIQAMINPTIPAGKEVAILHMHAVVPTVDAGVQFVKGMKESQMLRSIPRELRKIIINFATGQNFIGDVEILRGDSLDVVELRGGDQYRGTLKEPAFALETFYGKVDLPVDQVIAMINVGRFRPRQLIVTVDGQIFGGRLSKDTLDLELSSKQVIKVPLAQVTRVGYRKRDGEPEEWTFEKPLVLMRTGERVGVQKPTEPLTVHTRYGKLTISPETVAAVMLQSDEHGVHEIRLTDGSRFAGLLEATSFPMKLDNASGQAVMFPASGIARMQFTNKTADPDAGAAATLGLTNGDLLVGSLGGKLAIDTAFDTITVNAEEIRSLAHQTAGSLDVSVTLWDGSVLSGQLQEQELSCTLQSGLVVKVPVALVEAYEQPQPAPSPQVIDRIKAVVADLNAEDWKKRDRAEAGLVEMGPVAIGILKQIRGEQPPEAQQRIDSVVKALEKERDGGKGSAPKSTGAVEMPEIELDLQLDQ